MRKHIYSFGLLFFMLLGFTAQAQEKKLKRGEKQIENYSYTDAIKIYERLAKKGIKSEELFRNLGDSYYFNGQLTEANVWYTKLFELTDNAPSEYFYRYSQTLKSLGNYDKANEYLTAFTAKEKGDSRGILYGENKDYLDKIKANSDRYTLSPLSVNSQFSDYGATVYDDKLIFTTARDTGSAVKRTHTWTGGSFTNLYYTSVASDGTVRDAKPFAKELRTKFNESTPVFTSDGKTMYFTRNNYLKGDLGVNAHKITLLKIYRATLENGKWTDVTELPFNSDDYSTAHPALSADGKWLYFASDRSGGKGQSDLYRVKILSNGNFGDPENLGDVINTPGRESFPFITDNDELYFATDGHPGLGGLDIYVTKINSDGSFTKLQNIGAPANSEMDDFSYYINISTRRGFLSSNRTDNKKNVGVDNIYSFLETRQLSLCVQNLTGLVYDKATNEPLVDAEVVLMDTSSVEVAKTKTDSEGRYKFEKLACSAKFKVTAVVKDYNSAEALVNLLPDSGTTIVNFGLEKIRVIVEVKKGDDLFKVLNLNPIYFDYNKSDIRPDAALELSKIVEVLRGYPKMRIDVRAHTDSRGKDAYNLKLSDSRAKSTVNWIISQGIDSSRVQGRGYGETQLLNRCKNGVNCSEEEHQENRRSEFIVLEKE